jgi:hypothetical protein
MLIIDHRGDYSVGAPNTTLSEVLTSFPTKNQFHPQQHPQEPNVLKSTI